MILFIDEMYIKENIVYSKHTGRIVGFTDLGDVNNHLLRLDLVCCLISTLAMGKTFNFYLTDWRGLQLVSIHLRIQQKSCSPSWSVAFVQIPIHTIPMLCVES